MKLKGSTVAWVAIALLLAGGLYLWDQSQSQKSQTLEGEKSGKPLFAFKENEVTALTLQSKTQTLSLAKTAKGWQIKAPASGAADDGTVAFLLNLLATGTAERTLPVAPAQLKDFGLAPPATTISIQLQNQTQHQLLLGTQTFDQSAVYAQVDPAAKSSISVVLIPTGFLDAVNRPLGEWQAKQATPATTPLATPTVPGAPASPGVSQPPTAPPRPSP